MISSSLTYQFGLALVDDLRQEANERRRANKAEAAFNRRGYADSSAPAREVGRLRERHG